MQNPTNRHNWFILVVDFDDVKGRNGEIVTAAGGVGGSWLAEFLWGQVTMRRRFAMAVGSCLAVAAAGTAQQVIMNQQPVQAQQVQAQLVQAQPAQQYRSPFVVGNQPAPMTAMPAVAQPMMVNANGNMQAVQYIPVQPIQTYTLPAPQPVTAAANTPVVDNQASTTTTLQMPVTMAQGNPSIQYIAMQPVPAQPTTPAAPAKPAAPQAPAATSQIIAAPSNMATAGPLATNGVNAAFNNNCNSGCNSCGSNNCQNNNCQTCEPKCCNPCGPEGRMWVSAEYLLWWARGMGVPALVTSSPAGTPRENVGVLGAPGTTVLFGDEKLHDGTRSGFRLRVGGWLDDCRTCGIEASYFFLGESNEDFSASGGLIARPFYNIVNARQDSQLINVPGQDSQLINFPGVVSGTISVESSNCFNGFDVNFRKNLKCDCCGRTDFLLGFRYLKLQDDLTIREDLLVTGTDPNSTLLPGTRFQLFDTFDTRNEFYGPQFGLTGEMRRGSAFVNWRGLIAFGTTHKDVTINGATTITQPNGAAATYPGGLLALPTNIGRYSKNDFSVVPELNLNAGYQVTDNLRAFVGYSFIYWSNVTRVGDIIDTTINPTQLPPGTLVGPARPAFSWHDSDFWAHGVSFGAELRY